MEIKRNILSHLDLYLKTFPVVLLTGARQTGKTTLVRTVATSRDYSYATLDDLSTLQAAREDPVGFLERQTLPLVLDEVQRAPELFLAIKQVVDRKRILGRFLLTGSANPLLLPTLGDSLAGRMGVLHMFPFSQGELREKKETFLPWLFSPQWEGRKFEELSFTQFRETLCKGGFPAAYQLPSLLQAETWMNGYLETMMMRDIRDLAQIEKIHSFPELLRLLASRSGSLLNGADLARTLKLSTASIHRYLSLLEALFFIFRQPAWFINHAKRVAKSPKIYLCDSGMLCYLLRASPERLQTDLPLFGFILESFVAAELLKQASWADQKVEQYHYREGTHEVDIVLEMGNKIVGIEIKSSLTIRSSDFQGLKRLRENGKKKFLRGIILYTGSSMLSFGGDLWAVPLSALWK